LQIIGKLKDTLIGRAIEVAVIESKRSLLMRMLPEDCHTGVTISRGKAVQEGVRIKLLKGMTWKNLASIGPKAIREKDLFPPGFFPLPAPNHPNDGMLCRLPSRVVP
jgi:hypothetical protein